MKKAEPHPEKKQVIETKTVKHRFTSVEREELGQQLAQLFTGLRNTESEFDQIKADFKAKIANSDAQIDLVSTSLVNGFDMRQERCVMVPNPARHLRMYFLELLYNPDESDEENAVLTEPMKPQDYQTELPIEEGNTP